MAEIEAQSFHEQSIPSIPIEYQFGVSSELDIVLKPLLQIIEQGLDNIFSSLSTTLEDTKRDITEALKEIGSMNVRSMPIDGFLVIETLIDGQLACTSSCISCLSKCIQSGTMHVRIKENEIRGKHYISMQIVSHQKELYTDSTLLPQGVQLLFPYKENGPISISKLPSEESEPTKLRHVIRIERKLDNIVCYGLSAAKDKHFIPLYFPKGVKDYLNRVSEREISTELETYVQEQLVKRILKTLQLFVTHIKEYGSNR